MSKQVHMRSLIAQAKKLVIAEQKVSFEMLRKELKVGMGVVVKVLKRLDKAGITGYIKGRTRGVLLDKDGTPKKDVKVIAALLRKRRRKSRTETVKAPPIAPAMQAAQPAKKHAGAKGNGTPNGKFSSTDKIIKLNQLSKFFGGEIGEMLISITNDLVKLDQYRAAVDKLELLKAH